MKFCENSKLTGCLLVTHLPVKAELQRRPELAGRSLIITAGEPSVRLCWTFPPRQPA